MSRRHYDAIAFILRIEKAPINTILRFANLFEADNPKFNRDRFLKACEHG